MKEHSPEIIEALVRLKDSKNQLPPLFKNIMQNEFRTMDIFIVGAIKKSISIVTALENLITNWNMLASRAILRVLIDILSRLNAFWISPNMYEMASEILHDKQFNQFTDKNGQKMSDGYLIKQLNKKYPWIEMVYKYTSDYIHFSKQSFYDTVGNLDDDTRTFDLTIQETDYKFSDSSWLDIINCAIACLEAIKSYLIEYEQHKIKTPLI